MPKPVPSKALERFMFMQTEIISSLKKKFFAAAAGLNYGTTADPDRMIRGGVAVELQYQLTVDKLP